MKAPPCISDPNNQRLLTQHMPLVKKIARQLAKKLPANVECDDLIQDGMLGLIDAILRSSKETTRAQFESYVIQRARGAMLDGLRTNDPGNRQLRQDMRRVEAAIQQLGHQQGRMPYEREIANQLGLTLCEYQQILQAAHGYVLISLEDLGGDDADNYLAQCCSSQTDPLCVLERADLRRALSTGISALPLQKKTVLQLYYEEEQKMRVIGNHLHVSKARVSQMHAQAIAQLRALILEGEDCPTLLKPRNKPR
jgi:RNA polymerase sigma factor for flagellar operon FliA